MATSRDMLSVLDLIAKGAYGRGINSFPENTWRKLPPFKLTHLKTVARMVGILRKGMDISSGD